MSGATLPFLFFFLKRAVFPLSILAFPPSLFSVLFLPSNNDLLAPDFFLSTSEIELPKKKLEREIQVDRALLTHHPTPFLPSAVFQVKTWYDPLDLRLVVTVLSAADLPPRTHGQYRNPYAKVYLQPNKR